MGRFDSGHGHYPHRAGALDEGNGIMDNDNYGLNERPRWDTYATDQPALFTVAGVGPSTEPVPGERALFDVIADKVVVPDASLGSMRPTSPRPPTWKRGTRVTFTAWGFARTGTFVRRFTPARHAGFEYEIRMDDGSVAVLFANGEVGRSVTPILPDGPDASPLAPVSPGWGSVSGGKWHRTESPTPTWTAPQESLCGLTFTPMNVTAGAADLPPTNPRWICKRCASSLASTDVRYGA